MTSDRDEPVEGARRSRSTGPRTTQGKARSRANAVRHGLSSSVVATLDESAINQLEAQFQKGRCAEGDLARRAAEAHYHYLLVRNVKQSVLLGAALEAQASEDGLVGDVAPDVRAMIRCSAELIKLGEYERKALSRRRRALRALFGF